MVVINQAAVAPPGMLKLLLPIFLASLVVACGRGDENAADLKSGKVLHVYNWADYIAESTIQDFEARTGIKVVYDVYDTSEVLETKLLTGSSGDVVVVPYRRGTTSLGCNKFATSTRGNA